MLIRECILLSDVVHGNQYGTVNVINTPHIYARPIYFSYQPSTVMVQKLELASYMNEINSHFTKRYRDSEKSMCIIRTYFSNVLKCEWMECHSVSLKLHLSNKIT